MALKDSHVLLMTLPMDLVGGVQTKARFLASHLHSHGHHVTIATYVSRSSLIDVNVSWGNSILGKKGRVKRSQSENKIRNIYVGSRFPGAEFTYTEDSISWRRVLEAHNKIIAVGGTPLIAYPAASIGKKFILWCADDLNGDREARMAEMLGPRKIIDKFLIMPKLLRQQSAVLSSGMPLRGVSTYTTNRLNSHVQGMNADIGHLPIPIESDFFHPVSNKRLRGVMGFAGRISDRRKNARLLFEAFQELRRRNVLQELHIAGPVDNFAIKLMESVGISDSVTFHGNLSREQLRGMYQSLEIFAITSHREGLGISGLEAMACGVPVVSTQCGGPEDFVKDGITGYISSDSPIAFADCVCDLLGDSENFKRISKQCRQVATENFSEDAFSDIFEETWMSVWGDSYRRKE